MGAAQVVCGLGLARQLLGAAILVGQEVLVGAQRTDRGLGALEGLEVRLDDVLDGHSRSDKPSLGLGAETGMALIERGGPGGRQGDGQRRAGGDRDGAAGEAGATAGHRRCRHV